MQCPLCFPNTKIPQYRAKRGIFEMFVSELKNKKENYTLKLTRISQNVQLLLLMFALSRTVIQQIFFIIHNISFLMQIALINSCGTT